MMAKQALKSEMKSLGKLENCRVIEVGIDGVAECVQQGQAHCSHVLPLGYCFLCLHPRLGDIIENTKKAQAAVKV
jgi:hypothetical protein